VISIHVNHTHSTTNYRMKSILVHRYRPFLAAISAALLAAATTPPVKANDSLGARSAADALRTPLATLGDDGKDMKEMKEVKPAPSSPLFNVLFNIEFADKYVTPRGMIVRDRGLTYQPLLLVFLNAYHGDGFINSVTFVGGVWNDFGTSRVSTHPPYGSEPKTAWTEIDPIGGISIGFAKRFKLDVTYTSFVERILDIETSHHLETKLSFDDSDFMKAFALHPYVSYWQELDRKATDADVPQAVFGPNPNSGKHPQPGSSFYFEIGIDPSYTFKGLSDLKLEAPCRVLLADDRFFGEYYKSASTLAIYELGLKASIPLKFMPGPGHWSVHAGFKYLNFVDDNLYHLNTFNDPGKVVRDTWQAYGGFSVFF
jgi:hypothetical protein